MRALLLVALLLPACGPDLPAPAIEQVSDPLVLTDLAAQAVAVAPAWLRDDLAIALSELEEVQQDDLAALLVDLDDPRLLDEVAFLVAHTSPEVFDDDDFHPQLIAENAALLYAYDEVLPYVELVDEGEPGVDDDYHTTATYRVEVDGVVEERTLEPAYYYWYVVHFRMEDEYPYYIDGYARCSSGSLQCPEDPDEGQSWRDFLWSAQDPAGCPSGVDPCPVLSEVLSAQDVLWKGYTMEDDWSLRVSDNGAVGALSQWILDVLDFGAGSERSVQPNRIYGLHRGNCGEHADMTTAAGRTGLLPVHNVGAWANDHTWNEFWDGDWQQMEPVNGYVDFYGYYADANKDYYRTLDRLDNDCDGVADEGTDTTDSDTDGVSIAEGDCDDTDPDRYPGAPEENDGEDDDCDGTADDGTDAFDADGDGWAISEGDCDDTQAGVNPGAADPAISSNRVLAITAARGDGYLWNRTDAYGGTFTWEVTVQDAAGQPVEGADVTVFGEMTVYPEYAGYVVYVTDAVTGADGVARIPLGEANAYYYQVHSVLGSNPPEDDRVNRGPDWPEAGTVLTEVVALEGTLPARPAVIEADAVGEAEPEMDLAVDMTVARSHVRSTTFMFGDTFMVTEPGGSLDVWLMSRKNYELYVAGEPFEAQAVRQGVSSVAETFALPLRQDWYVVLANPGKAVTWASGTLALTATPAEGADWEEPVAWDAPFRVGPGESLAVRVGR